MGAIVRRRAVITGATGGMGQACARRFGGSMDLVLAGRTEDKLAALASVLERDGYIVAATIAGDLGRTTARRIAEAAAAGGGLGALVHTAAVSQAMAEWDEILRVDWIGTVELLNAVEPILRPGSAGILIASMAGHLVPSIGAVEQLLDDPFSPDFLPAMGDAIAAFARTEGRTTSQIAYGFAKRAVMRVCEQRAPCWAERGARINSISPGVIYTSMGRTEVAQNPFAADVLSTVPVGRWGQPSDIAEAAWFLAGNEAGFISGTDLRVDGGVTTLMISKLEALRHRS
jgi:NAD(P)-dependent dehydrogenase (short-subunit alcohol dehydrogenase family)